MRTKMLLPAIGVLCLVSSAGGQTPHSTEINRYGPVVSPFDSFGTSMAVSEDFALVGAPRDDERGKGAGAVYVYRRLKNGWRLEDKLFGSLVAPGDWFGTSVAIHGDVAAVGAPLSWVNITYVFRLDGSVWKEEQILISDDLRGDSFGISVDLDDDLLVVGAPRSQEGSVYVFRHDGNQWVREARLMPSDGGLFDEFGYDLDLEGSTILVGSHEHAHGASITGSAYVFRFDGIAWVEEAELLPSDLVHADEFGQAVALSGGVAAVGAPFDDTVDRASGAVYVYRDAGGLWQEEQKLIGTEIDETDFFGTSIALRSNLLIVGCQRGDSTLVPESGIAYLYEHNGNQWSETEIFELSVVRPRTSFSRSIVMQKDRVFISGVSLSREAPVGEFLLRR